MVGFIEMQLARPYGTIARWHETPPGTIEGPPPILAPVQLYRLGLGQLDALAEGASFSGLRQDRKVRLLSEIERGDHDGREPLLSRFFALAHENTIEGYFSDPVHGGNKGAKAWAMIGFPGCGHDYSDLIRTHRNRPLRLPVQTIEMLAPEPEGG